MKKQRWREETNIKTKTSRPQKLDTKQLRRTKEYRGMRTSKQTETRKKGAASKANWGRKPWQMDRERRELAWGPEGRGNKASTYHAMGWYARVAASTSESAGDLE